MSRGKNEYVTPALRVVFFVFHFSISNNYAYSPTLLIFILFYFKVPGHLRTIKELLMLKKEDHLYFSLYVILFEILANDCSLTPMFYF
jgi:hypothetical protein